MAETVAYDSEISRRIRLIPHPLPPSDTTAFALRDRNLKCFLFLRRPRAVSLRHADCPDHNAASVTLVTQSVIFVNRKLTYEKTAKTQRQTTSKGIKKET